jgi:hypothetical protein
MRTATETVYICDYCDEQYAMEEDCRSCEQACAVLKPIIGVCPETEDFFENLGRIKKFEMGAAVVESIQKHMGALTQPVDDASKTTERPPGAQ